MRVKKKKFSPDYVDGDEEERSVFSP